MDVTYLDFNNAFSSVSHNILVSKLGHHRLDGWTTRCVENWLDGWAQRVLVKELCSTWSLRYMEHCSDLSWDLSCVMSFIFKAERGEIVQPGEKKAVGRLNSRLPKRRLLRRCSQSLHSDAWQKDERQ